jgi:hypothetical protein
MSDNEKNYLELPAVEFDIVTDNPETFAIRDKVVNKVYTWTAAERKWSFPRGSRLEVINILTGVELD